MQNSLIPASILSDIDIRATGYNTFAIPLAAGVAAYWGLLMTPTAGAVFMSASTVIVAINAKLLGKHGIAAAAATAGAT